MATLTINSDFTAGTTNAGVTIAGAKRITGFTVSQVTALSFSFTGSTTVGGDPRFNIPVTGGYVFIAGNACFSGSGPLYTVDAINNSNCAVQSPTTYYPNWAAFIAAEPNLAITGASYTLIDEQGTWTIQNVYVQ